MPLAQARMPRSAHDSELLAAARSGDAAARDALVRRYWPRVFALGLQLSGSRAEAEDLAQDVMLTALSSIASFRGESELFTWLYRIALRRALRERKKHRRFTHAEHDAPDSRLELALSVDAGSDPQKQVELREQYTLLLQALDALSPTLRAAVLLIAVHGLSLSEASEALSVPEGTVGWRVHEARKQMRATIARLSQPRRAQSPRLLDASSIPPRASLVPAGHRSGTLESLRALLLGYAELELLTASTRAR